MPESCSARFRVSQHPSHPRLGPERPLSSASLSPSTRFFAVLCSIASSLHPSSPPHPTPGPSHQFSLQSDPVSLIFFRLHPKQCPFCLPSFTVLGSLGGQVTFAVFARQSSDVFLFVVWYTPRLPAYEQGVVLELSLTCSYSPGSEFWLGCRVLSQATQVYGMWLLPRPPNSSKRCVL